MANNQVEIEFLAKEEVTKALSKIEGGMGKLKSSVADTSGKQVKEGFFDMGKVAEIALGFTLAGAAAKAADAMRDFAVQGIKDAMLFEQQMRSLEIQTRGTARAFLVDLREATSGAVSDLDLVLAANRALSYGLEQETIPALLNTARALSKIQGTSVVQATNDIVTGIGRASPMILDNIGIVLDVTKVYNEYAASVGTTADALTKQQQKIALNNAAIEESAGITRIMNQQGELLIDVTERGSAAWKNLGKEIGSGFNIAAGQVMFSFKDIRDQAVLTDPAMNKFSELLLDSAQNMRELKSAISDAEGALSSLQARLSAAASKELPGEIENRIDINKLEQERLGIMRELAPLQERTKGEIGIAALSDDEIKRYRDLTKQVEDLDANIANLKDSAKDLSLTKDIAADEAQLKAMNLQERTFIDSQQKIIDDWEKAKASNITGQFMFNQFQEPETVTAARDAIAKEKEFAKQDERLGAPGSGISKFLDNLNQIYLKTKEQVEYSNTFLIPLYDKEVERSDKLLQNQLDREASVRAEVEIRAAEAGVDLNANNIGPWVLGG